MIINDSIPVTGLYDRAFTSPGSRTYLIPGIVTEVSAIFVARITYADHEESKMSIMSIYNHHTLILIYITETTNKS